MSGRRPDEPRLRAELRAALAAAEPRQAPVFRHVFTRASAGSAASSRSEWRPAAVAAAGAAALAAAWLLLPRHEPDADADYRLAVAVVAQYGEGAPTDRWLRLAPSAPLAGLPELTGVEYPLIPEETLL